MTRMESVAFQGAKRERDWRERAYFVINSLSWFFSPQWHQGLVILRQNRIKKQKKLIICKCPNSVHLESIVEKEEKLINWRSAKQVLGSQFFSSAFSSFFSSSFFSVSFLSPSFLSSDALSFTESPSSFSATLSLSVLPVAKQWNVLSTKKPRSAFFIFSLHLSSLM